MITMFLTAVGIIVVFGVLCWLINQWVPDTFKKFAWSALVVIATVIFLYFIFGLGNGGASFGTTFHR
jgi:hypothetical protein